MILQFLANGLVNGSLIALVALGFSLVYNTTRIFHIAYAGIYVWAGYLFYYFMEQLLFPLPLAFLMAMAGAGLMSLACEKFIYSPLLKRKRSANSLMISSVGVLILLVSLSELLFGNAARYFDIGLPDMLGDQRFSLSGFRLMILITCLVIMAAFFAYLKYSRMGIRIRALRDDEVLSRIYGIKTKNLRAILFVLSGVFAAIAAGMNALDIGINPHLGIPIFINAFVAMVIGGIGRFDGPVIGGILLGLLQATTEYFFDSRWVMMVTFILLILFLFIRPQGLIPEKSRAF